MSKKKKIIILSCMVLLLAVTAVFNFVLSGNIGAVEEDGAITTANYFTQYKTERTESRNEQLLLLDQTIASSTEDATVKTSALEMKLKLTSIIEQELLLEKLIQAKGYENSVVSIGLTSDNINVIVKDDNFSQDDAIVIYTILSEEASASPENVKIIPIS